MHRMRTRAPRQIRREWMASLLVAWTVLGSQAAFAAEPASSTTLVEPPLVDADLRHWSYVPPQAVEPPQVQDAGWVQNDVDRFILKRLEDAGLQPYLPCDARTLIRRVTWDLTGLPPTREEIDEFLADTSPEAYEKLVDRLLASPARAEQRARRWLDLARYADTDGFEHDLIRPEAWKYRDWVVGAYQSDMPYDEFLRQQIAGDELYPSNPDAAIATGFLLCGPDMPDLNLQEERRHNVLNEMVATLGTVCLGLQIGCAQCHDHKYDPISQADFYRLRACLETAELFGKPPQGRVLRESSAANPAAHVMLRGDFRSPGPTIEPGFPRVCNPWGDGVPRGDAAARTSGRRTALARWLSRPDHPLVSRVAVNRIWQDLFCRGLCSTPADFGLMGQEPTHPELLDWLATQFVHKGYCEKWLQKLLVMSATYRAASRALRGTDEEHSHEAMERWSRLCTVDGGNRLFGRANARRLDAEEIRDGMLFVSDLISLRKGGSGVMAELPAEVTSTLLSGQWQVSPDEVDHRRRSIYLFVRRNLREPLLDAFDRPDTLASCARRSHSTTAPQALTLFNSDFSWRCACQLAEGLLRDSQSSSIRIQSAYERVLGRRPSEHEELASRQFLDRQARQAQLDGVAQPEAAANRIGPAVEASEFAAWADFCLALMNVNEFLYVD